MATLSGNYCLHIGTKFLCNCRNLHYLYFASCMKDVDLETVETQV